MQKLFASLCFFLVSTACLADEPRIGGAWVELRKSPLFEAPTEKLSPIWGGRIQTGDEFQVEKVFGRWLFGKPAALKNMKAKDEAPSGWIYSRMLLLPGDENTASKAQTEEVYLSSYYSNLAWKKMGINALENPFLNFNFLENLVLSRKTMLAFRHFDEQMGNSNSASLQLESIAEAADAPKDSYGLLGADLDFLKQEFTAKQNAHQAEAMKRRKKILSAPRIPALNTKVKSAILGRYMINKYFTMPQLSHDEVDGFVYMKAIAERTLEACPKKIQAYWQKRHWNIFRIYQLKSHLEEKNPWLQLELPGGYFAVSARAIDTASNEAELAYLLIRPMVRAVHIPPSKVSFGKKWPEELANLSEEQWLQVLKDQSTLESKNVDVADEILVDQEAVECVSRAGYASGAPLSFLKRISQSRSMPWASWLSENMIGIDYRVERLSSFTPNAIARQSFPAGSIVNQKRFSQATKGWNILQ